MSRAQTIAAPAIQCAQQVNSNGNIILEWTDPPNNPCGAFVQYTIYASSTGINGPYDSIITVTSQEANSDTLLNYLSVTNNWYFYMVADYNCPGYTSLNSDTVLSQSPATPIIVAVTVVNGHAEIIWDPSVSPQVNSYVVYNYLISNGLAVPFDTVQGRLDTTLIDLQPTADPNTQSLAFTVSAKDSSGCVLNNISSYNTAYQSTIYTTAAITECQQQVNIAWTKYVNWPQGVLRYQVWVNKNNAGFDTVYQGSNTSFSFEYTNFNDGDSLDIYVEAISAADTNVISNSNVVSFKAQIVEPPKFIYITNLSVDTTNNEIFVTWTVDTMGQLLFYKILRSPSLNNLVVATQFGVPSPIPQLETYDDSGDVYVQDNPYYYEVVAYDSCQNTYTSPYGETVYLQGALYDYFVAHLSWNDFQLQNATVTKYNLYRDYGTGYQLVKSVLPGGANIVFDSLENYLSARGTFCYYVEAEYTLNLPPPSGYTAKLTSTSNVVCIVHRPVIYIPNAFSPGEGSSSPAVNEVFKPTIIYGDPHGYSMLIFNRWGAEIFNTNDPTIGWDGADHGKPANIGGYAYKIQFTADDGVLVQRQGIVLLVR